MLFHLLRCFFLNGVPIQCFVGGSFYLVLVWFEMTDMAVIRHILNGPTVQPKISSKMLNSKWCTVMHSAWRFECAPWYIRMHVLEAWRFEDAQCTVILCSKMPRDAQCLWRFEDAQFSKVCSSSVRCTAMIMFMNLACSWPSSNPRGAFCLCSESIHFQRDAPS